MLVAPFGVRTGLLFLGPECADMAWKIVRTVIGAIAIIVVALIALDTALIANLLRKND